jgi:hypothetical protein
MNVRRGNVEPLSFEEAIDREPMRLAASDDPASSTWRRHSYLARGTYSSQLDRWFEYFPRDRFSIIKSEEFYEDPVSVLREAQTFLDVESHRPASLKAHHRAEYAEMDPGLRQRLREYFAPHNRRLYDLLGWDLGWE